MSLDIFDRFDNYFKKVFRDFTLFDNDWDEIFKDFNESINFDGMSKNYKISYHYDSEKMKEPEIKVEGKASQEDIDKFLKGVQKRFGKHLLGVGDDKVKLLESGDDKSEPKKYYKIPRVNVSKEIASETYTFEMPGIGKDDIETNIEDGILTIKAENGDNLYKKRIKTEFNDDSEVHIETDNGIIKITVKNKKK
jgi:HSP20 family molecular chaperone IbpA